MAIQFNCGNCGRTMRADDQYAGRNTVCPACKTPTVIPAHPPVLALADAIAEGAPPPVPARRVAAAPGTCPECGAALGQGAVLCIECGYDLRTGKKRKTRKRRLKQVLDRSVPLWGRIIICILAVFCPAVVMAGAREFVWWLLPPALFIAAAFATPYGYVFRITIRRNRAGDLVLKKEYWVCLAPLDCWAVKLNGYTEAWTDYAATVTYDQHGRPHEHERFMLDIAGGRKKQRRLYDGPDGEFMRELADLLQYDAGLQIKRK